MTGFTNSEEAAVGLTEIVPFLVEDELKAKGGIYSKTVDWAPYAVTDGLLITGQKPGFVVLRCRRSDEGTRRSPRNKAACLPTRVAFGQARGIFTREPVS